MIRTLKDVSRFAQEKGPKRLAVLAPEDGEFMPAVKKAREMMYIEPVLIGDQEKINRVAAETAFDINGIELLSETDRQAVANLETAMLFAGGVSESFIDAAALEIAMGIVVVERRKGVGQA